MSDTEHKPGDPEEIVTPGDAAECLRAYWRKFDKGRCPRCGR